jgi:hypothetical protein
MLIFINVILSSINVIKRISDTVCYSFEIHGDSLRGDPELIVMNYILFTDENKTWHIRPLVDVDIAGLQRMLKSVSLCPKREADLMLHVHKCCSQHGRRDCSNCISGTNWAGRQAPGHSCKVHSVANFCFPLVNYCLIYISGLLGVNHCVLYVYSTHRAILRDRNL